MPRAPRNLDPALRLDQPALTGCLCSATLSPRRFAMTVPPCRSIRLSSSRIVFPLRSRRPFVAEAARLASLNQTEQQTWEQSWITGHYVVTICIIFFILLRKTKSCMQVNMAFAKSINSKCYYKTCLSHNKCN